VDPEVVEAIQAARDEVSRKPSSAHGWGALGEVLLAHEFNPEANRCFQQAELLDPRAPAWPYLQGLNLVAHDPVAGLRCLERAVPLCDSSLVSPRLLLAETSLEQGRLDDGQFYLEDVLQYDPGNLRARLGLGRLALLRQNWQAGLDILQDCQYDSHTRKRAHTLRAEAWNQLGQQERARAEQQQAVALPPDQPWPDPFFDRVQKLRRGLQARFQTVNSLLQARRMDEALQLLNQTREKYPQSVEVWMRTGEVWHRLNQLGQAQACFQQAVQLAPDMAEAWVRLASVQALAHSPEAEASFRQAIRLKPNHAPAHFNLGQCLKEQGQRGAAIAEFREALRCRPDYDLARTALRELDAQEGKSR
jgi:tetratricopeptide (TPR) repeat protein